MCPVCCNGTCSARVLSVILSHLQSFSDRISFQLTSPSQPPTADNQALVQEVSDYIEGSGDRPSWVVEGVASEIALGSAVASPWVNSRPAGDYISRRCVIDDCCTNISLLSYM